MVWMMIMTIMATIVPGRYAAGCDQGEVYSALTRHKIQVLLEAGIEPAKVAALSKASVDTGYPAVQNGGSLAGNDSARVSSMSSSSD